MYRRFLLSGNCYILKSLETFPMFANVAQIRLESLYRVSQKAPDEEVGGECQFWKRKLLHFLFQNQLDLSGIVERYVDQSEMLAVGGCHIVDGIRLRPKPDGQTVVGGIHELMQ